MFNSKLSFLYVLTCQADGILSSQQQQAENVIRNAVEIFNFSLASFIGLITVTDRISPNLCFFAALSFLFKSIRLDNKYYFVNYFMLLFALTVLKCLV